MKTSLTRRDFVTTAAVGAAALTFTARSYARIAGANDRIRIAQIGCGGRGRLAHMDGVHKHDAQQNAEFVAVSDPGGWRAKKPPRCAKSVTAPR